MSMTSTLHFRTGDSITSSPKVMSNVESSQLTKAVTALKVGSPSPRAKTPITKSIKARAASELDSGYASKNTSQSSTPDSLNGTFVEGRGVVGGTRAVWGLARPKIKLTPFDKPIPMLTQNRFEDLRELHADNLNKLTRGLPRCRGILMSLKILGENESTAAPWVFIQCDKAVAGKVRRFFKQPCVESDFKPRNPDAYTPKFEIYVHEMPPMALHGKPSSSSFPETDFRDQEAVELYCDRMAIISSGSLCGSKISVSNNGHLRSATIGGLISVVSKEGKVQELGITAGHFLAEEQYMEGIEDGEEYDDGFSDDSQDFELDLSSFDYPTKTQEVHPSPSPESIGHAGDVFGHVYKTSQTDLNVEPNLDWALCTIDHTLLCLPNVVDGHRLSQIDSATSSDTETLELKVVLKTAMSGSMSGILSKSWSYLSLFPGRSLVRTNAVTISDKKGQLFFLNCSYNFD